jgi:hypothetical protein
MFAATCLDLRVSPWSFFTPMLHAREPYIEGSAWRRAVRHALDWADGTGNDQDVAWLLGFRNHVFDQASPTSIKRKAPAPLQANPTRGVRAFYALLPPTRKFPSPHTYLVSAEGFLSPQI